MRIHDLVQRMPPYDAYRMHSGGMPHKADRQATNTGFTEQVISPSSSDLSSERRVITADSLTSVQKETLLEKLHSGRGNLSLEEWDGLLQDLVGLGLIDSRDRLHASGKFIALPSPDKNGTWHSTLRTASITDRFSAWNGDPLAWLDQMDLYLMKECKYATVEGNDCSGLFDQKTACAKVYEIVASILGK